MARTHPKSPYVLLSCAQSLDGYLDDSSQQRLLLSNDEDFDRVDAVRASVDAILVGANTVRTDNPRLLVRSEARQQARRARDLPPSPVKVTVVRRGTLAPDASFFTAGEVDRLVYCPTAIAGRVRQQLGKAAIVIDLGKEVTVKKLLADLAKRNIHRLMVEGGQSVLTQFLVSGLVDELQVATAGFFVGDKGAPRFVGSGHFPWAGNNRLKLQAVKVMDDVITATYLSPERDAIDHRWMDAAFAESRKCPPTDQAYSVGAVIVAPDGTEIARGYSREGGDDKLHAEEAAIAKVKDHHLFTGATMY
ncbi:MAG: dihydrofolate reductase family protein, partial [Acidobacteriota bacterium]